MQKPITFTASAISGSGRGKDLGFPTINVNLASVPEELSDGIYACQVAMVEHPTKKYMGAMHYGERPVFRDSRACEVHIIDEVIGALPADVTITVVKRLRDVENFGSVEALKKQIEDDVERCRAILASP